MAGIVVISGCFRLCSAVPSDWATLQIWQTDLSLGILVLYISFLRVLSYLYQTDSERVNRTSSEAFYKAAVALFVDCESGGTSIRGVR